MGKRKTYSLEFKLSVIDACKNKFNGSKKATAKHFEIDWSMVKRWSDDEDYLKLTVKRARGIQKRNIKRTIGSGMRLKYPEIEKHVLAW